MHHPVKSLSDVISIIIKGGGGGNIQIFMFMFTDHTNMNMCPPPYNQAGCAFEITLNLIESSKSGIVVEYLSSL